MTPGIFLTLISELRVQRNRRTKNETTQLTERVGTMNHNMKILLQDTQSEMSKFQITE